MLGTGRLEKVLRKFAGREVDFPGWQDPILFFETAGVVLSTSKHESWGASMVEALLARVPVVACDVGIAKEAGAIVVEREKLSEAVKETLDKKVEGELKIKLLNKSEWAAAWKETL